MQHRTFQKNRRFKTRRRPIPTAVLKSGKSPALRGFVGGRPGSTTAVLYPSTKIEQPGSPHPESNLPQKPAQSGSLTAWRGRDTPCGQRQAHSASQRPTRGQPAAVTAGARQALASQIGSVSGSPPDTTRSALGSMRPSSHAVPVAGLGSTDSDILPPSRRRIPAQP